MLLIAIAVASDGTENVQMSKTYEYHGSKIDSHISDFQILVDSVSRNYEVDGGNQSTLAFGIKGRITTDMYKKWGTQTEDFKVCCSVDSKEYGCVPSATFVSSGISIKGYNPNGRTALVVHLALSRKGEKISKITSDIALDAALGESMGFEAHAAAIGMTVFTRMSAIDGSEVFSHMAPSTPNYEIIVDVLDAYSIQRATQHLCQDMPSRSLTMCSRLAILLGRETYRAVLTKKLKLPPVQRMPTPENPFFFMHIEKSGGTSFRKVLKDSAESNDLAYVIPCHNAPCATFSLEGRENLANVSVVGGHLSWNQWFVLPSWAKAHKDTWIPAGTNHTISAGNNHLRRKLPLIEYKDTSQLTMKDFTIVDGVRLNVNNSHYDTPMCLTLGRHPIERSISYYYQRLVHLTSTCMNA
jgi:hypothetical protein